MFQCRSLERILSESAKEQTGTVQTEKGRGYANIGISPFFCPPVYRALVQTFPNNEVRHTLTKVRSPRPESSPPSPESAAELVDRQLQSDDHPPLLDISGKLKTTVPERVRAASKFGTDARRAILRSGAAMESRMLAPSEGVFFTGTLPGSTPEAMSAIASRADFIVNGFKAWLSKYQQNRLDIYVWELQKRGALHLHFVSHIPHRAVRQKVIERFHDEWCNLLDSVGKDCGVDMYRRGFGTEYSHPRSAVQAYAVEVKKSVAAYLAKYVSKTHNVVSKLNERYAPKRFWGRSRPLKALTDSLSTSTEMVFTSLQDGLTYIRNIHDDLKALSVKQYNYRHTAGVGETFIAFILRSSWDMAKNILSLRSIGTLTEYGKKLVSKSKTILLLDALTENFYQFGKSSRVGTEPGYMDSLRVCKAIQSNWRDSGFGSVKVWINNLLVLSSSATCMKVYRWNPSLEQNRNLHPIAELWKLRELIWSFDNPTWEDIKICDRYLDRIEWSMEIGTKPSDDGEGNVGEPELSSLPSVCQVNLW